MKKIKINIYLSVLFICFNYSCQIENLQEINDTNIRIDQGDANHPFESQVEEIINKYVDKGLPGVSIVIDSPSGGILRKAAGYAKIEDMTPMETHHVFNSGSVAKTYHVVAALILMEEGLLDIDKTIDNYLPEWVCDDLPNGKTATVKQLMNHTSGIPDFIEEANHILDYFHDLYKDFTQEDFINYICGKSAWFEAGATDAYSNTNTVLLALIMDEITGDHTEVITEKIINKLGLQQTFYKNELGYPSPAGSVDTYLDLNSNGEVINSSEIQSHFDEVSIGHDGMLASANDFHLFLKALINEELINAETLQLMANFQLGLDAVLLSEEKGPKVGHDGGSFGAANEVYYYTEIKTYMVVCSNFGNFFDGPLTTVLSDMITELEVVLYQ